MRHLLAFFSLVRMCFEKGSLEISWNLFGHRHLERSVCLAGRNGLHKRVIAFFHSGRLMERAGKLDDLPVRKQTGGLQFATCKH